MRAFSLIFLMAASAFAEVPFYNQALDTDQDVGAINQNFRSITSLDQLSQGETPPEYEQCIFSPMFCVNQYENKIFVKDTSLYISTVSAGSGGVCFPDGTCQTSAGVGSSAISIDASYFSGNGTLASPLSLLQSTVTLMGNGFNGASQLLKLDTAAKVPVANLPTDGYSGTYINVGEPIPGSQVDTSTITTAISQKVAKAGDTMTGSLIVGASVQANVFEGNGASLTGIITSTASIVSRLNNLDQYSLSTGTAFGGDVSGAYGAIDVTNDGHLHTQDTLSGVIYSTATGGYSLSTTGSAATITGNLNAVQLLGGVTAGTSFQLGAGGATIASPTGSDLGRMTLTTTNNKNVLVNGDMLSTGTITAAFFSGDATGLTGISVSEADFTGDVIVRGGFQYLPALGPNIDTRLEAASGYTKLIERGAGKGIQIDIEDGDVAMEHPAFQVSSTNGFVSLGANTYSDRLYVNGNIKATGTISGLNYYGDGSNLTGVVDGYARAALSTAAYLGNTQTFTAHNSFTGGVTGSSVTSLGGAYFVGNVGIRDTTPDANLEILATSANTPSSSLLMISSQTDAGEIINVLANGSMGIGNASPNDRLDVAGYADLTSGLKLNGIVQISTPTDTISLCVGRSACNDNLVSQAGIRNTVVGGFSGKGLTNGTHNSIFGSYAAGDSTGYGNAYHNTFIGAFASYGLMRSSNTYVGFEAGSGSDGSLNTYLGIRAGKSTTGSSNVFLGKDAGMNRGTISNAFIVANSSTTELMYGNFSTGNVGIGNTVPDQKLSVTGNISAAGVIISTTTGGTPDTTTATMERGLIATGGNMRVNIGPMSGNAGSYIQARHADFAYPEYQYPLLLNPIGGNVGIGTTAPVAKLDVSGSVNISSATIKIYGTGAPTTGGALCLNASGNMAKCTSAIDASGNCTCP